MSESIDRDCQSQQQGVLLLNEPLAAYTTWRIGGQASKLYKPHGIEDLSRFLKSLPEKEPLLWLGLGSNILIRDKGFSGTVILTQGKLKTLDLLDETHVYAEAGVSCASMSRFCARNHLAGAEFWAGIPGTIGGALRMNAGCHGSETWDFVEEVCTMNRQGEIRTRTAEDFEIAYRHVEGLGDEWFVSAKFKLEKGDKEIALSKIKALLDHRSRTQPTSDFNCGSVFRNPPKNYAAQLIESCGLKGFQMGHAKVSPKHANFIINHEGKASAKDIEALISHIQDTVRDRASVHLIQEVHIIGEKDVSDD